MATPHNMVLFPDLILTMKAAVQKWGVPQVPSVSRAHQLLPDPCVGPLSCGRACITIRVLLKH